MEKMKRYHCSYRKCINYKRVRRESVKLFAFPRGEASFEIWAKRAKRYDLLGRNLHLASPHYRPQLCFKHFKPCAIKTKDNGIKTLKPSSLPVYFKEIPIVNQTTIENDEETESADETEDAELQNLETVTAAGPIGEIPGIIVDQGQMMKDMNYKKIMPKLPTHTNAPSSTNVQFWNNLSMNRVEDYNNQYLDNNAKTSIDKGTQCNLVSEVDSPYMRKLTNSLKSKHSLVSYYKSKLRSMQMRKLVKVPSDRDILLSLQGRFSDSFFELFKLQFEKNRPLYSHKVKMIALSLYFGSPVVYRTLLNIMKLPTEQTIRQWVQCMEVPSGWTHSEDEAPHVKEEENVSSDLQSSCSSDS